MSFIQVQDAAIAEVELALYTLYISSDRLFHILVFVEFRVDARVDESLRIDPTPSSAAGHLMILPGLEGTEFYAVELRYAVKYYRTGWHVDPQSERLRSEQEFDISQRKEPLHHFLERGEHPGVMIRHTVLYQLSELHRPYIFLY